MKVRILRQVGSIVFCAWAAVAGCRTAGPADAVLSLRSCGRVIRVDQSDRYVVLECGRAPPAGAVVELRRGGQITARIRVTAMRRGSYVAADIEEGDAAVGDIMAWAAPRAPEADK